MMRLTEKQQAAVNGNGDIIVSAAAGSGKTRVMTERIIKLISEGADIREMAVMTYTSTAAAEMKSRIYRGLISQGSRDEHMRLQADFVPSAKIGTCHSLCVSILRENYELAGLSYNFSVINEEVCSVLKKKAAVDTITDLINEGDEDTLDLLKCYSKRLNKDKFYEQIKYVAYQTRDSYSDPDAWLDYCDSITADDYERLIGSRENVDADYELTVRYTRSLTALIRKIRARYGEYKAEMNGVDFADMMIKACAVLREKDITFSHVFVDEFQDTNPVQKDLIDLLSRHSTAFYVGDRKQCIFAFNDAVPQIFTDTADAFRNGKGTCLYMNENFRSSAVLIDAVNHIMGCAMTEDVGGVTYDDDERLIARSDNTGEVRLILHDANSRHSQSEMIAEKIESVVGSRLMIDEKEKEIGYGDIAVLIRYSKHAQPLSECLHARNIPYITKTRSKSPSICAGFLVSMIKALENSGNDLAMLEVMKYRGVGFTDDEIARIRLAQRKVSFTTAIASYLRQHDATTDPLAEKLHDFMDKLDRMRSFFSAYSLEGSLFRLAEEFSLFDYAKIKSGAEFEAVIELIDMISGCGERTLTGVVQYLESKKDRKSGVYAYLPSEKRPDSVNIMTIHKSKGLEFPVVFIAFMEDEFYLKSLDASNYFIYDKEYGILPLYRNKKKRQKRSTVMRDKCVMEKKAALVSEEIRDLYVAMTRAKGSLYMCTSANFDGMSEPRSIIEKLIANRKENLPYNCLLDYVLEAYAQDYEKCESFIPADVFGSEPKDSAGDVAESYSLDDVPMGDKRDWIVFDRKVIAPAKISVSALKKMWGEKVVFRPRLFEKDESVTGSDFGTMIHILMQKCVPDEDPEKVLNEMTENHLISAAEAEMAYDFLPEIRKFLCSQLSKRIKASDKVLKEVPFSLEIDSYDIGVDEDIYGSGTTLLQGVIDLAFRENDEWVVIDYKTDRVRNDNRDILKEEYGLQLGYYSKALEEITGTRVAERYIAFLRTGETVTV